MAFTPGVWTLEVTCLSPLGAGRARRSGPLRRHLCGSPLSLGETICLEEPADALQPLLWLPSQPQFETLALSPPVSLAGRLFQANVLGSDSHLPAR